MDRRQFLAVSGIAASAPMLVPAGAGAATGTPIGLFDQVQFTWDGLGLSPREYASVLSEVVADPAFRADNYSLGGSLTALEQTFAHMLGKEAALFVPTGTLANHLAIRKLAGADRRVLVQAESHLFNDSGDCAQTLSGLNLIPLAPGSSTFTLKDVTQWVERTRAGRVALKVGVIAIESPVRRTDHAMFDFDEMRRISVWAREQGIRLHLDGARLFNLPLHSGHAIGDYTGLFDTVYVSLWKHFNAGSGAILAGDADFIEGLFHERRMFGSALPRAWPETAVAARFVGQYEQDYAAAWRAAETLIRLLEANDRFTTRRVQSGTSRFFLKLNQGSADALVERALLRGVALAPANPVTGEIAMQVNPSILRKPAEAIATILIESLGA